MNQKFGDEIRKARKKKGYTLRQLAPLVEIDFTYLSKLENDRADHPPSEELVRFLAKILNLDEERLIYLAGRITRSDSKLLGDLAKKHPDEIADFFRRMRENPERFLRAAGKPETG
jgi:HTH-type transcriptional regulator, competence development regulator